MTTVSSDELSYAHISNLKADGNSDIAKILEHLLKNPQDVQKVKKCLFVKKKDT
jgi:hypothetical protein